MSKDIISPIAIDLGAKNTGVFYAHYEAGSALDKIEKSGKVYQLDSSSYTYLMASRTAKRHQKRGHDRRQMAKRLFKLIWENHLKLPWDKETQQAISFLMNRRGFSYLTEEYDAEFLAEMPEKAKILLNDALGLTDEPCDNFREALVDWTNEGEEKVGSMYAKIEGKTSVLTRRVKRVGFLKGQTNHLRAFCKPAQSKANKDKAQKDLKAAQWVVDEWVKQGIKGLPTKVKASDNLAEILEKQGDQVTQAIFESLEATKYLDALQKKERELKALEWGFEPEKFKLKELDNVPEDNAAQVKIHLRHFAFALHKNLSALQSGGRPRKDYFEEVKAVLSEKEHEHDYLKRFCTKLQKGEFDSLTVDSLTNLIGHISNLELKPLRKYFNDKKHRKGDQWDNETRMQEIVHNWMIREWRVGEKDTRKDDREEFSYQNLKSKWTNKPGSLVKFWLENDPNLTIPPYQANNNRRPPRCQSLLLNVKFLDEKYSNWKDWLSELKATPAVKVHLQSDGSAGYEKTLKELRGRERNKRVRERNKQDAALRYFSDSRKGDPKQDPRRRTLDELDARVLQFILDRVKAEDPLKLNEIYSHAKKLRQIAANRAASTDKEAKAKAKDSLKQAIEDSQLPDSLKSMPDHEKGDLFADGSFLHLVCKYYKNRQRARDGRVFIHPEYKKTKYRGFENTGRFDDRGVLLTYCNHKPRQKRYQMLGDLAALLQMSPSEFGKRIASFGDTDEQRIDGWLKSISGLKSRSEQCAKEQKDRRGSLKLDIKRIYFLYHQEISAQNTRNEKNKALGQSGVKLHNLCEAATRICREIQDTMNHEAATLPDSLGGDPATAVHLLAQIHNIAFKERQGNANTCAVCSMDNAQRMHSQMRQDAVPRAQRLPAIPTRVFDGAVKRIANIVGGAIAEEKWKRIESDLKNGHSVCVPIITESNQFEFEPSKDELLKGVSKKKPRDIEKAKERRYEQLKMHDAKQQRIREAGRGVCPYQGVNVGDEGQLDHILPRASSYGTINDEANLIYASIDGNKTKGNREYTLGDLSADYKRAVFGTSEDGEIENWIIGQIDDREGEPFTFGSYRSFINLDPEQQKAFRHALFLRVGHPLRDKVIRAISNRNRAIVNGTQRFFAEVIANKLYKKALASGCQNRVSFDYFGIDAKPNSSGSNTYELRKHYERPGHSDIGKYAKQGQEPQEAYSHLIDAMMAFVIAADEHRNGGSLKVEIDGKIQRICYVDTDSGEIVDGIYNHIQLPNADVLVPLTRRKSREGFVQHRSFTRDTFYADHYLAIFLGRENGAVKARIGFSWRNSVELGKQAIESAVKSINAMFCVFNECKDSKEVAFKDAGHLYDTMRSSQKAANQQNSCDTVKLTVNKSKMHEFLIENYNTKSGVADETKSFILDYLHYRTERMAIKSPKDIDKVLGGDGTTIQINKGKALTLPVKTEWLALKSAWGKHSGDNFEGFLRGYFKKPNAKKSGIHKHPHQKTRRDFSLPVRTKQGKMLIRKKSWNGRYIYQILNDSDSRKNENKPFVPVLKADNSIGKRVAKWAASKNIVMLTKDVNPQGDIINPDQWWKVNKEKVSLPAGIDQLWYRIEDNTSPYIAIKLAKDGKKLNAKLLDKPVCRLKNASVTEQRNKFFADKIRPKHKGAIITYKGGKVLNNSEFKKAFKASSAVDKPE